MSSLCQVRYTEITFGFSSSEPTGSSKDFEYLRKVFPVALAINISVYSTTNV